eukprot:TRINITY_DN11168_c0_g1_i2.p2 TRINITY_DN11168_c0_g1~~TRINITY_DN11168_c0_g1_i2.p2  ORF type:complete len:157 (-),score=10.26 TRINITY_DN11168_c0_g1_i2:152-622(-)
MRQVQGYNSRRCGYVSIFPATSSRFTGYLAGFGGWGDWFVAGVNTVSKVAEMDGDLQVWHKIEIDVSADGNVYFFFDGVLGRTESSQPLDRGVIRFGRHCSHHEYRNAAVQEASCDSGQNYKNILMLMKNVSWGAAVEKVSIEPFCQGNVNLTFRA